MDTITQIISEAARASLSQTQLTGEDLEIAVAAAVQASLKDVTIQRNFNASLNVDTYVSKANGEVTIIPATDVSKDAMGVPLPTVLRKRQRKLQLNVDHVLPSPVIELFNTHYSKSLDVEYTQTMVHDHPEAAASRKIETELVMLMLREKGADLLRKPVNGYDMSVTDVGGDWRYHYVRHHFGVHTDAPFLDARDQSRDSRKTLTMSNHHDNRYYLCRNKMEKCEITSPFMMAIHSVLYTTKLKHICESMAKRGTKCFIGTMQLPEDLDRMTDRYIDPHYGYTIDYVDSYDRFKGKYVPPHLRAVANIVAAADASSYVYRYPAGMSNEYVHDVATILEKANPTTLYISTGSGRTLKYHYKIVKRVGSLIFCEILLDDEADRVHMVPMISRPKCHDDGYAVSINENLLKSFAIKVFRQTEVIVPKQLFTAVSSYCLTKVRDPNFCIETAISYSYSASNSYEANGVVLHKGSDISNSSMIVTTAIAAFFWAFERYRLMESRLPQLALADKKDQMTSTVQESIKDYVGISQLYQATKSMLAKSVNEVVADLAITQGTTYADIGKLYEKLSEMMSPGVSKIRDLSNCYSTLVPMTPYNRQHGFTGYVENYYVATQPLYELELNKTTVAMREKYDIIRSREVKLDEPQPDLTDIVADSETVVDEDEDAVTTNMKALVLDAILLKESQEIERSQTAMDIYMRVFDELTRDVRDLEVLKGTIKGRPTLLYFQETCVIKIWTLEAIYLKGTAGFETMMTELVGERCIYPEKTLDRVKFGTCVVRADRSLQSDRKYRTMNQVFTALIIPELRVMNASRLSDLKDKILSEKNIPHPIATLANECAGSGKTHDQCMRYKLATESDKRVAVFASTKAAAGQVKQRLTNWQVVMRPNSISTVDSFLMNPVAWSNYDEVYIDEALQLHAGLIVCIAVITKAKIIRGYGDRKQIGFINRSRFHAPACDTNFKWHDEQVNLTTRRIPADDVIVPWLRHDEFYGPEFKSLSNRTRAVVITAAFRSFEEKLSVSALYRLMAIPTNEKLMVLTYTQDETARIRSKLNVKRTFREDTSSTTDESTKMLTNAYNCCCCSIGESQGEDVDNVVVLRLSAKAEPLYTDFSQTTVALTRHKKRWGYLGVVSQFNSTIEDFIAMTANKLKIYKDFEAAVSGRQVIN